MKHKTLAVLCAVVLTAGMMTGCGQKTEAYKDREQQREYSQRRGWQKKQDSVTVTGEESSDKGNASDAKGYKRSSS